jgi:hypothetical protein
MSGGRSARTAGAPGEPRAAGASGASRSPAARRVRFAVAVAAAPARPARRRPAGLAPALAILVCAALCTVLCTACAGFRHGYTLARVEGQVLNAAFGPGAQRLETESRFDGSLRTYVADKGPPDYIYVLSSTQV